MLVQQLSNLSSWGMDLCDKEEKWNNMGCLKFYDLHASTKLSDVASASAKPKKNQQLQAIWLGCLVRRQDWRTLCQLAFSLAPGADENHFDDHCKVHKRLELFHPPRKWRFWWSSLDQPGLTSNPTRYSLSCPVRWADNISGGRKIRFSS